MFNVLILCCRCVAVCQIHAVACWWVLVCCWLVLVRGHFRGVLICHSFVGVACVIVNGKVCDKYCFMFVIFSALLRNLDSCALLQHLDRVYIHMYIYIYIYNIYIYIYI